MSEDIFNQVRDKDHIILNWIEKGENDVHRINQSTKLTLGEINYSFRKLEDLGLIQVEHPNGTVERVVDGQKRVFDAPKTATLTQKGRDYLEQAEQKENLEKYEGMSRRELIEKLEEHENRIESLEKSFEIFQEQVKRELHKK